MMHYQYVARDATGRFARGVSAADSPANLRTTLQANGLQLISFQQQSSAAQRADWMNMSIDSRQLLRRLPVASRHVELCLQQLALMLRSGLDLLSALKTIRHQSESLALRYALEDISRSIQQGHSLASAMEAQRAFPPLVIQLVKVGEESGDLSRVLQQAARHISQRRATLAEVRMALAYPLIVGVAALGIAIYLIFNVIPELQKFINAMGRKLPRMTQNLVDLAQWIQANGTTTIIISTVLVFFAYVLLRWSPTRLLIDTWLLRVPIVGSVFRLAGTATLASSLAVMIRSGTKLVTALSLAESLQTNRYLAAQVANASEAIKRGEGLSHTLASGHGYNPMLVSMLEVAERTGHLEASLEDVAEYCEVELRKKVKRLSAMVEPAIILVAGGIVGYVYMAFFMALMSTGGNIR